MLRGAWAEQRSRGRMTLQSSTGMRVKGGMLRGCELCAEGEGGKRRTVASPSCLCSAAI